MGELELADRRGKTSNGYVKMEGGWYGGRFPDRPSDLPLATDAFEYHNDICVALLRVSVWLSNKEFDPNCPEPKFSKDESYSCRQIAYDYLNFLHYDVELLPWFQTKEYAPIIYRDDEWSSWHQAALFSLHDFFVHLHEGKDWKLCFSHHDCQTLLDKCDWEYRITGLFQKEILGAIDDAQAKMPLKRYEALERDSIFRSPSGNVLIKNRNERPVVMGIKKKVTDAQLDTVIALLEAGEIGLSKDDLDKKSGRTDARKHLGNLRKCDTDWKDVIQMPGKKGNRYRIL